MDKSHVTMEQQQCPICGKTFDTGSLLLDTRLRPVFDRHTVTGLGLCPDCKQKETEGYIALIGVDPSKSPAGATLKLEDAYRTGRIAHIRRSVFPKVFNCELVAGPFAFCDDAVITMLEAMTPTN